jgi:aspartyl-tRNA(Asn)/glutamyl-tRNA(Gln) amidotransferase subunit C
MAKLSIDDVRAVARLARLRLEEDELESARHELGRILDYFAALARVDVSDVEPTAHVLEMTGGGRSDEAGACLERREVLGAAPDAAAGCVRVPRVIG